MSRTYRATIAVLALLLCGVAPTASLAAQSDRGTVAREAARLTTALNQFFKRYAADASFAQQFVSAAEAHDYATAANLASKVTGVPASEIRITATDRPASGSGSANLGARRAEAALALGHGPRATTFVTDPTLRDERMKFSISFCLGIFLTACINYEP